MLKMASKLPPRWLKIATWAQLGPTWLHLVPPRGSKRRPRGSQVAPKMLQEAPKKPHLHHRNEHFVWEVFNFCIIPTCVQYVAVRPPPGPRSAGFNPAAAEGQPAVSDHARTYQRQN